MIKESAIAMLKEILESDELFDLSAQLLKKSVDALVKAGFTKEEALQIVTRTGSLVGQNK